MFFTNPPLFVCVCHPKRVTITLYNEMKNIKKINNIVMVMTDDKLFILFQAPAPNTRRTQVRLTTSTRRPRMPVTVTAPPAPAVFSVGISRNFWCITRDQDIIYRDIFHKHTVLACTLYRSINSLKTKTIGP